MARAGAFEAALLIIILVLCAFTFFMLTDEKGRLPDKDNWNVTGEGPVSKIFVGEEGTPYLFGGANGNTIYAIGPDGNIKWAFEPPDGWFMSHQTFAVDNGSVYLYAYAFDNHTAEKHGGIATYRALLDGGALSDVERQIVAVSDHGKMLWSRDVPNEASRYYGGTSMYAVGGRLYYYNNESVMVFDRNGRVLFNITGIYGPPAVDEHGDIFIVKLLIDENGVFGPGTIIEAYGPDGKLRWSNDLGRTIYGRTTHGTPAYGKSNFEEMTQLNSMLFYQDSSLYAFVDSGIVRLSTNGSILWSKTFPFSSGMPLQSMPVDSQGNLYYQLNVYPPYIGVITPEGKELIRDPGTHNATLRGRGDGTVYYIDYYFDNATIGSAGIGDLMYATISAYNILEDRYLWNYSLIPDATEMLIGSDNAEMIQPRYGMYPSTSIFGNRFISTQRFLNSNTDEQIIRLPNGIACNWGVLTTPGNDVLYLDYYSFNWQSPDINNKIACLYSNHLYAIADNGTLLWEKPLSSLVAAMAVNNSTLYYSTKDGGFFVENGVKIIGGGLGTNLSLLPRDAVPARRHDLPCTRPAGKQRKPQERLKVYSGQSRADRQGHRQGPERKPGHYALSFVHPLPQPQDCHT
jgi:hypothetical protein